MQKAARQAECEQVLDSIDEESKRKGDSMKDTVCSENIIEPKMQMNQVTEVEISLKAENDALKLEVLQLKETINILQTGLKIATSFFNMSVEH